MQKNPYYLQHETAYQSIKSKGEIGWQKKDMADFRDPSVEGKIRPFISKYFPNPSGLKALDLGCGSGPTAHFLNELGFKVTGIDVSATAIELARSLNHKFDTDIEFISGDVTDLAFENRKFDFVYDSHCLHCIVTDEDRRKTFQSIQGLLSHNGYFLLDTMVYTESAWFQNLNPLRFDSNFILWHKDQSGRFAGAEMFEGELWCPQRRIYPADIILKELEEVGFKVVESAFELSTSQAPAMLRSICQI